MTFLSEFCRNAAARPWVLVALTLIGAGDAAAHSVSVGYVVNGPNSITVYYGAYHGVTPAEGNVSLTGPVTFTKAAGAVVGTKPTGLVDGVNNFFAGACSGGSLNTPNAWQSATFTGVPDGTYSIQLTGSFTINWQPCDSSISSGSSQFTFDTTPPAINPVPANMTVFLPAASNRATVSWTVPTATDANGVKSFTASHAPGSSFPLGATTVTYTAIDNYNNQSTANFTVTVIDDTPPIITGLPANMTVTPGPGGTTAAVNWTPPTATDNSGLVTLTSDAPPGSSFPLGVTTVTYTAVDSAGNRTTGSFTVTVADTEPPVIAACPASQSLQATGPSGASATWVAPTASDNAGVAALTTTHAPGSAFPIGSTSVTYTAMDSVGNQSTCSFTIMVHDKVPPVISGIPANVVLEATSPAGAAHTWTAPSASDLVDGNRAVTASHASGTTFPFSAPGPTTTTVTLTASDAATPVNTATAQFTVTVRDTTPPIINTMPANITIEATGSAGANVTFVPASARDVADPAPRLTYSHGSGVMFPIGITTVTVTATDASNNASTSTFTVTVRDTIPPVMVGVPADVMVAASGRNGAVATYTMPTASDLVAGAVSVTTSHPPGSTFPIGVTTVTFTAVDASGNVTTGSFKVTVSDREAPVITNVPANIIVEATGPAGATVPFALPVATDAADGARPVTMSHHSNATFGLGTTTVTVTAADLASPPNTSTATFQVTVVDTTPPVIGAVANITITAPDSTGAFVVVPLPTANDIVDQNPMVTISPSPGTKYPVGTHTVTVFATDASGNVAARTLTVTVLSPAQISVTPATGLVARGPQGQQGAPFAPTAQTFVVTNHGQVPATYAVSGLPAWATASQVGGILAPAASESVTVSLSLAADQLAVGLHSATLAFDNVTSSLGSTTRDLALTVTTPATLVVSGPTALAMSGPKGGAFSPSTVSYTLQNSGSTPLLYAVSGLPSWLTLSNLTGTIPAGGSVIVTATISASANSLPLGAHNAALTFTNQTTSLGSSTRTIELSVVEPARLAVTSAEPLVASGNVGGPFGPASKSYTLSNQGAIPLSFQVTDDRAWIDITGGAGVIAPGASTIVTVSINAAANAMASGRYVGTVTFSNLTGGLGNATRAVDLTVIDNGRIILKVVTTEGDGVFGFASPTTALTTSINSMAGQGQSAPITLNAGTYSVTATPPPGFGMTSINCSDNDSAGSLSTLTATIKLAPSETVVCTFASVNSRKKTTETIGRFMTRRNDLVLSTEPDAARQIDRLIEANEHATMQQSRGIAPGRGNDVPDRMIGTKEQGSPTLRRSFGTATALGGFGSSRMGDVERAPTAMEPGRQDSSRDDSQGRFAFAGSFSQFRRQLAETDQRRLDAARAGANDGTTTLARPIARPAYSPLDFWFQGRVATFTDSAPGSTSKGNFAALHVGADYIFNPSILVGMQGQIDTMRMKSAAGSFDVNGTGWMVGPYTTIRLSEHLYFQGRLAAGKSSNEISPFLTYVDHFETSRRLANATLVGRWSHGAWHMRPSVGVSYIQDVSKGYIDSLGVAIPRVKTSLGQLKLGPEVSYRHMTKDGWLVEPKLGIKAIWNFAAQGTAQDFGGTLAGQKELRGQIEMGLKLQSPSGVSIDLGAGFDGLGSDTYRSLNGKATVRFPLN